MLAWGEHTAGAEQRLAVRGEVSWPFGGVMAMRRRSCFPVLLPLRSWGSGGQRGASTPGSHHEVPILPAHHIPWGRVRISGGPGVQREVGASPEPCPGPQANPNRTPVSGGGGRMRLATSTHARELRFGPGSPLWTHHPQGRPCPLPSLCPSDRDGPGGNRLQGDGGNLCPPAVLGGGKTLDPESSSRAWSG